MIARLVLAASFLIATQLALQHPFEHLKQSAPAQHQQCDGCIAFASIGPAAVLQVSFSTAVAAAGFAATAQAPTFIAAFTPHFRSQAPPVLS
jgi:hypothetical protein